MAALLSFLTGAVALAQEPSSGQELARNAFPIPSTVMVVRDVECAAYGERRLLLDLYLPASSSGPIPGVLVVRGGSWQQGDKEGFAFIAGQLAKEGFCGRFDPVSDLIRGHVPRRGSRRQSGGALDACPRRNVRYRFERDRSDRRLCGGHLVEMLATSDAAKDLEGSGGNARTSSRVQAVVAMAGVPNMDLRNASVAAFIGPPLEAHAAQMKAASPISYVSKRSAPLLLLHSTTDPAVPFAQSEEIAALYRRAGATVVLKPIEAPNSHAFWNETRYFPETMHQAVGFLREHLK